MVSSQNYLRAMQHKPANSVKKQSWQGPMVVIESNVHAGGGFGRTQGAGMERCALGLAAYMLAAAAGLSAAQQRAKVVLPTSCLHLTTDKGLSILAMSGHT
jgi:hypothetical protein